MKANKFISLFIILSTCLALSLSAEDTCPSGMRTTYVDDKNMEEKGSGRACFAAVCFYDNPGALFFRRKVLIEPRFEVHLKASIDPVDIIENSREQRLYSFTIVISGNSNGVNTQTSIDKNEATNNGYNGFINSLIVEFDFQKDSWSWCK